MGLGRYVLYFALYMTSVEFFVYWQHRILHMGVGYRCGARAGAAVRGWLLAPSRAAPLTAVAHRHAAACPTALAAGCTPSTTSTTRATR